MANINPELLKELEQAEENWPFLKTPRADDKDIVEYWAAIPKLFAWQPWFEFLPWRLAISEEMKTVAVNLLTLGLFDITSGNRLRKLFEKTWYEVRKSLPQRLEKIFRSAGYTHVGFRFPKPLLETMKNSDISMVFGDVLNTLAKDILTREKKSKEILAIDESRWQPFARIFADRAISQLAVLLTKGELVSDSLRVGTHAQVKTSEQLKMPEVSETLTGIAAEVGNQVGSQLKSFLDAAEQLDVKPKELRKAKEELAKGVIENLSPDFVELLISTASSRNGAIRQGAGSEAAPSTTPRANLTVEEMQQELDKRTGKSFGSLKASKAQMHEVKGYLKASNLQLFYNEQPVTLRVVGRENSTPGSFVLVTVGDEEYVGSFTTWPPLTAAPPI